MSMKELTSYINGLTDGLELEENKKETKVILKLVEVIDQMAEAIDDLEDYIDELDAKVDEIDHDLGELEEEYYSELDDECDCCDCCDDDDDYEDYFDDDDIYEFTCDNCGETVCVDGELLDSGEAIYCPSCSEEIKVDFEDCE